MYVCMYVCIFFSPLSSTPSLSRPKNLKNLKNLNLSLLPPPPPPPTVDELPGARRQSRRGRRRRKRRGEEEEAEWGCASSAVATVAAQLN
jgi:hypothetical protein